jgi:hypothetical protein
MDPKCAFEGVKEKSTRIVENFTGNAEARLSHIL